MRYKARHKESVEKAGDPIVHDSEFKKTKREYNVALKKIPFVVQYPDLEQEGGGLRRKASKTHYRSGAAFRGFDMNSASLLQSELNTAAESDSPREESVIGLPKQVSILPQPNIQFNQTMKNPLLMQKGTRDWSHSGVDKVSRTDQ